MTFINVLYEIDKHIGRIWRGIQITFGVVLILVLFVGLLVGAEMLLSYLWHHQRTMANVLAGTAILYIIGLFAVKFEKKEVHPFLWEAL